MKKFFLTCLLTVFASVSYAVHEGIPLSDLTEEQLSEINSLVISIGIDYLGTDSQLTWCRDDVKELIDNVWLPYFGSEKTHITLLTEDVGSKSPFYPTASNIREVLALVVSITNSHENIKNLVIDYSGHGTSTQQGNYRLEKDNNNEAILPVDFQEAGLIIDDEISEWFNSLPSSLKVIHVWDACHSGTISDDPHLWIVKNNKIKHRYHERFEDFSGGAFRFGISACQDWNVALELFYGSPVQINNVEIDLTGGALTTAIQLAYAGFQGEIRVEDFFLEVSRQLEGLGIKQKVIFSSNQLIDLKTPLFTKSVSSEVLFSPN